jgi:DNA-binding IclR family transcriptional regulator
VGSPSVERAVQILDFLTTHPGRGFTLSELSRQLGISKATAHAILATLTDRGLLLRNPDTREYRSGPGLVPMGAVAERSLPALTHAKREAERLADEHDAECIVVMAVGEEILVVGRAGVPGPLSVSYFEGQRHPLAPPLGTVLLAWTANGAVDAWLDRLGPELTEPERERFRTTIATIRRQGYAAGRQVQRLSTFEELYLKGNPHTPAGRREISVAQAALAHDDEYLAGADDDAPPGAELGFVTAPVFGPDGAMLYAIALMLGERSTVEDIPRLSHAVVRAAGRVTAAVDGRQPGPSANGVLP